MKDKRKNPESLGDEGEGFGVLRNAASHTSCCETQQATLAAAQRATQKRWHYPKAFGVSILLLALFSWLMVRQIVHLTDEDRAQYAKLISEADPKEAGIDNTTPYSVAQDRTGIRKDYYYTHDAQRLHLRLVSENATLMMDQGLEGSALVEKMQNVVCLMQEDLFYLLPNGKEAFQTADGQFTLKSAVENVSNPLPIDEASKAMPYQRIRHFEAENASYHYQTGQFIGKNVKIMRYTIPEHTLPTTVTAPTTAMEGRADTIELSMSHGDPHFKATGFKAQINTFGGH